MFLNGYFWFKRWLGLIAYVCSIYLVKPSYEWLDVVDVLKFVWRESGHPLDGEWGPEPCHGGKPGLEHSVVDDQLEGGLLKKVLNNSRWRDPNAWEFEYGWDNSFLSGRVSRLFCSPAWFLTTTLSMPASSCLSISTKSPTVWVTGRRTNTQRSFLQGTRFSQKQVKLRWNNDQPCVKQKPVKNKFWI